MSLFHRIKTHYVVCRDACEGAMPPKQSSETGSGTAPPPPSEAALPLRSAAGLRIAAGLTRSDRSVSFDDHPVPPAGRALAHHHALIHKAGQAIVSLDPFAFGHMERVVAAAAGGRLLALRHAVLPSE